VSGRRIFVYGAGGHGKVVADILLLRDEKEFAGFVDDREELWGATVLGFPVLGGGEWLRREAGNARITMALGVGHNASRQWIAENCANWGAEIVTMVHPTATVSRAARVGRGTVVMANATVNADAVAGDGVIVNSGAVVEHDVEIGEYAHVAPNAAMGGGASLGAFSHLGIGASVLPCVHIGAHTVVGAGAVVVKNLPDSVVAMGVPARIHSSVHAENGACTDDGVQKAKL
jgi:sugar O-acyltransferase (sialic acid O-acetyltransferase NeuD family)